MRTKDIELFSILEILKSNDISSSSLRLNLIDNGNVDEKLLRNNLTNRKLGPDINFFMGPTLKIISRQIHQDKNGSSWMKIDYLAKELLEWKLQLNQDIAIIFLTGKYLETKDVINYCNSLQTELSLKSAIYIVNKNSLTNLLEKNLINK